jgi:hypothetical protein
MSSENVNAKESICRSCRGTGVRRPKDGPLSSDAGVFCRDCSAGSARWEATLKAIRECERPTVKRSAIAAEEPKVFMVG